jgi:FAD binding domain in molybdopterin dehydrogenase/Aldehyde oxidase and xanthine dehydrogenase, a/b hammerhead domain
MVKPAPFAYHRAHSVDEAVALLAELGDEAKILAGGLSLVPMMNFRLARPSALIDVTRVGGLSYLRAGNNGLRIGALTTHRTVETTRDPAVLSQYAVLPRSARWIGQPHAHARVTAIETEAALKADGVAAVLTAASLGHPCLLAMLEREEFRPTRMPILAGEVARFVGEPVAVVIAADPYQAEDAIELVDGLGPAARGDLD